MLSNYSKFVQYYGNFHIIRPSQMLPHGCDTVPSINENICLKLSEIFVLHTCTASASDTGVTRELSVGTGGLNLGGGGLDTRVTIPSILAPVVAVMGIVVSTITAVCVHRRRTNEVHILTKSS